MTTPTFTEALRLAEAAARRTLDVALGERITAAVSLVADGRVFQTSTGDWTVDSATSLGKTYTVNGSCHCDDINYNKPPQGLCKHRLAVYVSRRVLQLMQPPGGISATDTTPAPAAGGTASSTPLPEAPASVNVRLQIDGRDCQVTLRDSDEARLLERLAVVLQRYPHPQPPAPASHGEGWCSTHSVALHLNHGKDGRTWLSHRTAEGQWCKGK